MITVEEMAASCKETVNIEYKKAHLQALKENVLDKIPSDISWKLSYGLINPGETLHFDSLEDNLDHIVGTGVDITGDNLDALYSAVSAGKATKVSRYPTCLHVSYDPVLDTAVPVEE